MITRNDDPDATAADTDSPTESLKNVSFFDMMCIRRGLFGLLTEFV